MSFLALQPSGSLLLGFSRVGSTELDNAECTSIGGGGGVVENNLCGMARPQFKEFFFL